MLLKIILIIIKIQNIFSLIEPYIQSPQYYSQSFSDTIPAYNVNIPASELTDITETGYSVWFRINYWEKNDVLNFKRDPLTWHISGIYNTVDINVETCYESFSRWSTMFISVNQQLYSIGYTNSNSDLSNSFFYSTPLEDLDGQWIFIYQGYSITDQKLSNYAYYTKTQTDAYNLDSGINKSNTIPMRGLSFLVGNCYNIGYKFMGKYFNPQLYYGTLGSAFLENKAQIQGFFQTALQPQLYKIKTDQMFYEIQGNSEKTINESQNILYEDLDEFASYDEYSFFGWYKLDVYVQSTYNIFVRLTNTDGTTDITQCGDRNLAFFVINNEVQSQNYNCLYNTNANDNYQVNFQQLIPGLTSINEWVWIYGGYSYILNQSNVNVYESSTGYDSTSINQVQTNSHFKLFNPLIKIGQDNSIYEKYKGLLKNSYISLGPGSYKTNSFEIFRNMNAPPSGYSVIFGTPSKYQICASQCNGCSTSMYDCQTCTYQTNRTPPECDCDDGYYGDIDGSTCSQCTSPCQNCRNNNNKCISCINNHYFNPKDYSCTPCSYKCNNCTNSITDCNQCSDLTNRDLSNNCDCKDTFYDDGSSATCQSCSSPCINCTSGSQCINCINNHYFNNTDKSCTPCSYKCDNCTNSTTDCNQCSDLTNRDFSNNCDCKDTFYDDGSSATCQSCSSPCINCTSGSQCINCINNHYFNNSDKSCTPCSYKCDNCTTSTTDCNQCSDLTNRDFSNNCDCKDTFYDDGSSATCQSCSSPCINCTSGSQCINCINNHYFNNTDKTCTPCSYKCDNCTNSITDCNQCSDLTNRDFSNNCDCKDTFYDDGSSTACQSCQYPCSQCSSDTFCLTCHDNINRYEAPSCLCLLGYYELSQECLQCDETCDQCQADGCIEGQCKSNRNKDGTNQRCICPLGSIDHLQEGIANFYLCSSCQEAGYIQNLISDSELKMQFSIELKVHIEYTEDITQYNNSLCLELFENDSRLLFGAFPLCKILTVANNSRQESSIYIQFSYVATYTPNNLENSNIQFKQNFLQRVDNSCSNTQYINQFEMIEQITSYNNILPLITIKGATSLLFCQDLEINIIDSKFDGFRQFISINWIFTYENNLDNTQFIDNLNNDYATLYENLYNFKIPKFVLQEGGQYVLNINFSNYLNISSSRSIQINIGNKDIAKIELVEDLTPLVFEPWEEINIDFIIMHLQCQNGQLVHIQDTQLYYEINQIQSQTNKSVINELGSGQSLLEKQNIVSYQLIKYSFSPEFTYYIDIIGKLLENDTTSQSITLEFSVKSSPLFHYIEGGSRLQSYSQELNINAVFKDLNVPEEQQQQGFTQEWSCTDLNKSEACKNVQETLITFDQNESSQFYPKKFYNPFVSYEFRHKITKNTQESIEKVVITVIEMDAPSLALTIPESLLLQTVNLNDEIQIEIDYPKNPDELTFSAILIYELDKVAIKPFYYTKFSFKIINLFNDFINGKNDLIIKISCYDLDYLMPAVATFKVITNQAPQFGVINVTPLMGTSIETEFIISVTGYSDNDFPLTYKYQLYRSIYDQQSDIENGLQSTKLKRFLLTSFQSSPTLNTFLPSQQQTFDDQNNDISNLIIEVVVSDSKGALTNTTIPIKVTQDSTQTLSLITNKFSQLENFSDSVQQSQISILTLELQVFNKNKVNEDQNQQISNISNQIYTKLKQLQPSLISQIEQEQNKKATVIILEIIDSVQIISEEIFQENLQNIQNSIQNINEEFNNIQQQTLQQQQNFRLQKKKIQNEEILAKNLEALDQVSQSSIKQSQNKNQNDQNIKEQINLQNQKIVDNIKLIGSSYAKILLPNSDIINFQGQSINSNIQKSTYKPIQQLFNRNSNINIYIDQQANDGESSIEKNAIYNTQYQTYQDSNLFLNSPGFNITEQFSEKILDMNIFKEIISSTLNLPEIDLINDTLDFDFGLTNNTLLQQAKENLQEPVCQQQTSDSWNTKLCKSILDENLNLICRCQKLTAVSTRLQDVSSILDNKLDELKNQFSAEQFNNFLSFEYHKSVIFYSFLVSIIIQVLVIRNAYQKDKTDKQLLKYQNEDQNTQQVNNQDKISDTELKSNKILPQISQQQNDNKFHLQELQDNKMEGVEVPPKINLQRLQEQQIMDTPPQIILKNQDDIENISPKDSKNQLEIDINQENYNLNSTPKILQQKSLKKHVKNYNIEDIKKEKKYSLQQSDIMSDILNSSRQNQLTVSNHEKLQLQDTDFHTPQNKQNDQNPLVVNFKQELKVIKPKSKRKFKRKKKQELKEDIIQQQQQTLTQQGLQQDSSNEQQNPNNKQEEIQKKEEKESFVISKQNNDNQKQIQSQFKMEQTQNNLEKYNNSQEKKYSINDETFSLKDKQINTNEENKQEQQENKNQKQQSIFNQFWYFHELFWINFVFHPKQSRVARYLIYFIKSIISMAIVFFFYEQYSIYVQLAIGTIVNILSSFIITILGKLILSKKQFITIIGLVLYFLLYIISFYILIVRSSSMGLDDANEWTVTFLMSLFLDISFNQTIIAMVKTYIVNNFYKNPKFEKIIKMLIDKQQFKTYIEYFSETQVSEIK